MEWDGSSGRGRDEDATLAVLSTAHVYIQRNKAASAELQRAKESLKKVQAKYRECREAGDMGRFLRLEAQSQRFDCAVTEGDRSRAFFDSQYNEIYKVAKAWKDMQDPECVREVYGKIVEHTGRVTGDVMVKRYVNAEIRGLRRLAGNDMLPDGYRELVAERIECWRALQHEHERNIKRALEGSNDEA